MQHIRKPNHLIHGAGTQFGLSAGILAQQARLPHAAATLKHLQIFGQALSHWNVNRDFLNGHGQLPWVGLRNFQSVETIRV